jgi:hypothetical protein
MYYKSRMLNLTYLLGCLGDLTGTGLVGLLDGL